MSCFGRYAARLSGRLRAAGGCVTQPSLIHRPWSVVVGFAGGGVRRMTTTAASPNIRSIGPVGVILMIFPVGTFCLGTWQVQRRKWKLNLIEELATKTKAAPVEFPENLEDLEDLEYQRVKITGTFDHSREIYLGPRSCMVDGDVSQTGGGLISTGQSGFLVITPFKLQDSDVTVLVNRGWVPRKRKNPESRLEGQVEGAVSLEAVVRTAEKRGPFMPENTKLSTSFLYRDIDSMAQLLDTAPVFLDAVETFPGGPQGSQTRVTMRNEHLSYIMTWYSLSAATGFLWYRRFIRGKAIL